MLVTRKTVDAGQSEGRCSVLVRRKGDVGQKEDGRFGQSEGRCSVLVRRKGDVGQKGDWRGGRS